jgi:recombination protein RecA
MAKKKEEIDWSEMGKSFGADLLDEVDSVKTYIDSGVLAFNYVCSGKFVGGGIPSGKAIEIFGDSASGKSLIGANILKGVQTLGGVPILLDAERAVNKEFAIKASKVDPRKMFVLEADTLQQAFNRITRAIKKCREEWKIPMEKPIVVIYDSIAASPSEREFAETEIDMENATATQMKEAGVGSDKPGERAKECSKQLRKLPAVLKANNASVVFINQIREKIGVMFGNPETGAGGGRSLEYYVSLRLRLRANKVPKDKNGNVLGVNITVQNLKNRCFRPFVEAKNIYLFFEQGINPFGGLCDLLKQQGRISPGKKAGSYVVNEPWAGGQNLSFTTTAARNDIPGELLLKCPALVDAETPEQIQYYIDLYKEAIDAVDTEVASEEETLSEIMEG